MGVINVDFKKNLREMGEKKKVEKGGRGLIGGVRMKHWTSMNFFFLLTARYLLAGKGLDFPMS